MGSSWTRDPSCVSCIGRWILNHWTTREVLRASSVGKYLWMVSKFCQSQDLFEPSILLTFMVFWTCSASLGWSFTLTLKHNMEFESFRRVLAESAGCGIFYGLCTFYCQASVIFSVLSRLNKKLKRRTLKPLVRHSSWTDCVIALRSGTDCVIALRQISVTAPCYSSILFRKYQGNTSLRCEGMPTQRCEEKRETWPFGPSFYMLFFFFSSPLDLPYVNWASQECCLFYLRSSLWSSDLPLNFFCSIFMGFSFPCLLATAILDSHFLF